VDDRVSECAIFDGHSGRRTVTVAARCRSTASIKGCSRADNSCLAAGPISRSSRSSSGIERVSAVSSMPHIVPRTTAIRSTPGAAHLAASSAVGGSPSPGCIAGARPLDTRSGRGRRGRGRSLRPVLSKLPLASCLRRGSASSRRLLLGLDGLPCDGASGVLLRSLAGLQCHARPFQAFSIRGAQHRAGGSEPALAPNGRRGRTSASRRRHTRPR
jgi:hypothetical protein